MARANGSISGPRHRRRGALEFGLRQLAQLDICATHLVSALVFPGKLFAWQGYNPEYSTCGRRGEALRRTRGRRLRGIAPQNEESPWRPPPRPSAPGRPKSGCARTRRRCAVAFDTGEAFEFPAEFLRVHQPERGGPGPLPGRAQDGRRQAQRHDHSKSTRSAITRCGWCLTTCIPPAFSAGTISSSSGATRTACGATISTNSPPRACRAIRRSRSGHCWVRGVRPHLLRASKSGRDARGPSRPYRSTTTLVPTRTRL